MKKLFTILLALTLLLSMSVTALAADDADPGTDDVKGTITITNATIGETYKLYKIFSATHSTDAAGKTSVNYLMAHDNQFHAAMFPDGKNEYFTHDDINGTISLKEGVNTTNLIDYLAELVTKGGFEPRDKIKAENAEIKFEELEPGYYLIVRDQASAVTITSNTPNAVVIDKNQKPANLEKKIIDTETADGNPAFVNENTASIGDTVQYQVKYTATNYNGEKKIKYYQLKDTHGDGLWIDLSSIQITVKDSYLGRGCILNGNEAPQYVGEWGNTEKSLNNAQWYAVHEDATNFRITIPWLKGHVINPDGTFYTLNVDKDNDSLFDSPSDVVITYNAVVEENAFVGQAITSSNLYNEARLLYYNDQDFHGIGPSRVVTRTFGIGILKEDAETKKNLEGAKFRLYDANNNPVEMIPTSIQGVYKKHFEATDKQTGLVDTHDDVRWAAYVGAENPDDPGYNYGITPVNGKIIFLGLKAGTYTLREVAPPDGYNPLTGNIQVEIGPDKGGIISVFADSTGAVADIQTATSQYTEHMYYVTDTTVQNRRGEVLPSTGGETTMMFFTIGSVLTIAFAVLLITRKKMSIYED